MVIFKHATMLPYAAHLDYEQIHKVFAGYANCADQVTKGQRSAWGLHWSGNTLTIAFARKRDHDRFAKIFKTPATACSASAGSSDRGGGCPARTGKWSRRGFTSSYMLDFDHLDPEQIGQLGVEMSGLADHVTGDDRAAYEVWFHDDKVHVGFKHEEDRDGFADIIDQEAAATEREIIDTSALKTTTLDPITVH